MEMRAAHTRRTDELIFSFPQAQTICFSLKPWRVYITDYELCFLGVEYHECDRISISGSLPEDEQPRPNRIISAPCLKPLARTSPV